MSNERIEKIKTLAAGKGITADTVLSVLTLYTPEGRKRCLNTVTGNINGNTLDSDDIYLDIVMNGGGDDDPAKRGKKLIPVRLSPTTSSVHLIPLCYTGSLRLRVPWLLLFTAN